MVPGPLLSVELQRRGPVILATQGLQFGEIFLNYFSLLFLFPFLLFLEGFWGFFFGGGGGGSFLRLPLWHMEVPRLGVQSEL